MPSAVAQQILKRSENATKELTKAGVVAKAYTKAPITRDLMTVGMYLNRVYLWSGVADLELHPMKARRQAVVNAIEDERIIERTVNVGGWRKGEHQPAKENIVRRAQNGFGINLPGTAKFKVTDVVNSTRHFTDGWGEKVEFTSATATVVATVPRTEVSLLMGWDETSQFISALPAHAGSVDEAHDLLRGDVPEGTRRQGEWFFVPLTQQEVLDLAIQLLNGTDVHGVPHRGRNRPLEPRSSHQAGLLVTINGVRYARGEISDTRQGRHAPLILEDWHRVQRNREVVEIPAFGKRTRYWD